MLENTIIKNAAREAGFDLCAVTMLHNYDAERDFFDAWLSRGFDSGLGYLRRNVDKRFSPALLMDGARSAVVCAVNYKNEFSLGYDDDTPGVPKIASYALSTDYHDTIKDMLKTVAGELVSLYGTFRWRAFTDTAPLLEKRMAADAGLGFIGRNSLLVSPDHGSFLLLGELLIDRPVDHYDEPYRSPGCGECRRCVQACPNGALTACGIDTGRCISRLTIEKNAEMGLSQEMPLHGWIFGCDECQSVCPYNIDTPLYSNPRFSPRLDPRSITIEQWSEMTDEEFMAKFEGTPLERSGLERIKGNLCQ